ncbi:MAG: 7-carboxy-7-deazaguanine synthase QueE [Dehalococcoidia bacterium]|nr:7-carboxy-7-deazaguanine synthase QueE [Dehalococcoidia bacterium]
MKVSRQPDGTPEIFHSVQGEGASIGTPAVFLRLALCNLACRWCDTKYTWDWESHDRDGLVMEMAARDIVKAVLAYRCPRLVVTGGEPLVQQRELAPVLKALKGSGLTIEVETNGTIVPDDDLAAVVDQWNVSPKMESSGNSRSAREVAAAYQFFRGQDSADFKFVVDSEDDFEEVNVIVGRYGLSHQRVILMPQATDTENLLERGRWLAGLSKQTGYRTSTRLHVLLWGNRRGV